jgi:hypothetical protein
MSRQIDLEKKLSDEDRAYLKEWSRSDLIEQNDRQFGKPEPEPEVSEDGGQDLPTADAKPFWEEGKEPESKFVQRPFDPQVTGHFASEPVDQGGEPPEEVEIDELTVDELKDELKARNLSTSGNKTDLQKRLAKAEQEDG